MGKAGYQVEDHQGDVDLEEVHWEQRQVSEICRPERVGHADKEYEDPGDDDVYERAGDGDDELMAGIARYAFEACHSTDREQGDIRGVDSIAARGRGVTELVQDDAEKEQKDKQHGGECGQRTA